MKILSGAELAEFIKERQAKQVRGLRQALGVAPRLAIIITVDHPAIQMYVRMKRRYGEDILIDVDVYRIEQSEASDVVQRLNADKSVHGIIVQLPLDDPSETDDLCSLVAPEKDVDALGKNAVYDQATPMAILWLLAGYNIELKGKKIVLVGRGKLVGGPLEKILRNDGHDVSVVDKSTDDARGVILNADIIITATGSHGVIDASMIKHGAVVVDAGVAGEEGKITGDLAPDVRQREDLTITPEKGGVGPLTICALFDNVIRAAREAA